MKLRRVLAITLVSALLCGLLPTAVVFAAGVAGDVSGDGEVTAEDARLCLRQAVGLEAYEKESAEYIACDVTSDGEVTAEDARLILRAAVGLETLHIHAFGEWTPETDETGALTGKHTRACACGEVENEDCAYGERVAVTENKEPTCTEDAVFEKTCAVCGGKATETLPALGHSFGEAQMSVDQDKVCERCGETIPSFNTIVNSLKAGEQPHTYTGFSESYNEGAVTKHKFHISLAAKAAARLAGETLDEETIIKQFSDEMTNAAHEYTGYAFQRTITDQNFYRMGKNVVSDLTDADVQSMTVEETEGVDFIASLPDVVKIKSNYSSATFDFDLTEKIKAAQIGKVKKITVTLNEESYADIKDKTEESALMKGMDQDLRALVNELNQSEDMDGMKYEMKCDKAVSNGTITFYVDAETNRPIAATYYMDIASTESFSMDMKLGGVSMVDGSMTIDMDSVSINYYFFDTYFD